MHAEAYMAVRRMIQRSGINPGERWTALDIGGAYWNGSARPELPNADWTVLDQEPTQFDLDTKHAWDQYVVADATTWRPAGLMFNFILCTEVFEHVANWRDIIETAHAILDPRGIFIVTCASMGRPAHGATGAPTPAEGEWYANVHENDLRWTLESWFNDVYVEYVNLPGDAYALAREPR